MHPRLGVGWGVVLLLGLLPGLALSGCGEADGATNEQVGTQWYTAQVTDFEVVVTASGELEAADQLEVQSRVGGRPSIVEVIEEGTMVGEGDVLVRLDDQDIRQRIEQDLLEVEQARADAVTAEQELAIAQSTAESELSAAQLDVVLAELDLAKWQRGDVVQRRRELELQRQTADRRLERAERDLGLSQQLYDEQFISLNELEDAQIELVEARDAVASAELDAEVFEQYELERDRRNFEAAVESATESLERTQQQNESQLARRQAELANRRQSLSIREARLAERQQQLANTVIRAERDGMVIYYTSVGPWWQRRDPIRVGREVREGHTILLLPDTSRMMAAVRVHESQVPQVRPGQVAEVTIDARQGQVLPATVASIGVTAEDGGRNNPQLREYVVRLELPAELDEDLRPAMRCTAQIKVNEATDVLAVPIHAVHAEGDSHHVYVPAEGGRVAARTVSLGLSSETLVEITDGLSEGEQVLLRNPQAGEVVR
jgi:RND family efflux transporter MFP subunit